MTRKFKSVDYEAALEQTVSLREALPANHLARFVVDVVAELDLTGIYERYGLRGGEAYAPELLLALLFYGYATGTFSSRLSFWKMWATFKGVRIKLTPAPRSVTLSAGQPRLISMISGDKVWTRRAAFSS